MIEIMIASAITGGLAIGAYQMIAKYQKFMAFKNVTQNGQSEIHDLGVVIRKDWDYRLRENTAGVPVEFGYQVQELNGAPCSTVVCPQLSLWLNRRINNALIIDHVTISNRCVDTKAAANLVDIHTVDFTASMDTSCSKCAPGFFPQVTITGVNNATNAVVLAAENRVFPSNSKDLKTMNVNNTLGMQACFTQQGATIPASKTDPLSVTIRSFYLDMDLKMAGVQRKIRKVEKNQFYPFNNFANIQLEQ